MAKYKAYPEYKDSGVEWLGEIPIHWKMLRHKYVAFFTKGKNPTNLLEQPLKNTLPYLSMECLRNNTTDKYALISNDVRVALEGQPLIIWDGSNAGEFVKGKSGILSSTMAAATLTYPLYSQYYWYLCISIEPEMRKNAVGMGIPHVNGDELKSISFGIPSIYEQKQVAEFLDHETAKIDNLIEKQQQLIELLKEKRQAVISHAVTKGLNPDVPMKDSGVEWLGEVPEHWCINSLNHVLAAIGDVDHYMPQSVDDGIPYVMTGDLTEFASGIEFSKCKQVNLRDYLKLSKKIKTCLGDVIMARYATIGTVSYVDIDSDFLVSYSCVTIKPNPSKVLGLYLYYYFKSNSFLQGIQYQVNTNTQGNVGINDLSKMKIVLPSIKEQEEIIAHLQMNLEQLVDLSTKSTQAINLIQERRTALISAAVTGKIDVRDWVAPDTQDVEEPQEATA
ncbi:restriction endonuclease subunit S [Cronobacter dublinensis]|uniref:restriction endonuclease subunit S n=1 Tax=Cronobacter dublinensis TaxID=413497 RepID=UPI0024AC974D|nr:restriction endonuclease subunit S [Cronobacter dublinensis]EGT4360383.1 restriction endonuclease subunit S [Cronobacter dublinensis]MDI6476352.1 restriction endonuclease subunit S [Cronobacter dublinensis]